MVTQTFQAVSFQIPAQLTTGIQTSGGVQWDGMHGTPAFYPRPVTNANGFQIDVDAVLASQIATVTVEDNYGNTSAYEDESTDAVYPLAAEQQQIGGHSASPIGSYGIFDPVANDIIGRAYLVIVDTDGVEEGTEGTSSHQDWDAADQYYLALRFTAPGVTLNDFAGQLLYFNNFDGVGTFNYADIDPITPLCFGSDALIQTPDGPRKAGDLKVGDLVVNRDGDAIPIRWVGARKVDLTDAPADSKMRPVRISAGALGNGLPAADLTVSRQHRMLVEKGHRALPMDAQEALISAIKLTALPGIFVDNEATEVDYIHFLFDRHEVIYAEGSATESLFTGPEALKAIHPEGLKEVLELFPELASANFQPKSAAYIPPNKEQKQIAAALAQAR